MDRDPAAPPRPAFIHRPAARWTVVPFVGIVLAVVLVVALTGFFRQRTAATATTIAPTPGEPIYLTWADAQGYALGARDGGTGKLLWRDSIAGASIINGTPLGLTLADGTLYLYGSMVGAAAQQFALTQLTAVRASDGHVLWHVALAGQLPDPYVAPIVANGTVYATQLQNTGTMPNSIVSAFRTSDGHKLWDYAPGLRVSAMPLRENTLYMVETAQAGAAQSLQVEAVNAASGQRSWRSALMEGDGAISATLGSTAMLVAASQTISATVGSTGPAWTNTGYLHVLDLATGTQIWDFHSGVGMQATFDATGMTIFATVTPGLPAVSHDHFDPSLIIAFDARTGAKQWQHATDGAPSAPVVAGGFVYFTCVIEPHAFVPFASSLTALDVRTGAAQWHVRNDLPPASTTAGSQGVSYDGVDPPQVMAGTVYSFLLSPKSDLLVAAFETLTGHPRWSDDMGSVGSIFGARGTGPQGPSILLATPTALYVVAGQPLATTALHPSDGKALWTFSTPQNTASLIVGG